LIAGPSASFQKAASSAHDGQQTLANLRRELLLHRNQILRGTTQIDLPQHPVVIGLDRLKRN